jgi:oligopeptide transport system ATP-binding protein
VADTILQLTDVRTHFPIHAGFVRKRHIGTVKAVDGVTLSVRRGEVLGLVGESGCGKSTLARTIMQLVPTTGGTVVLNGKNLSDCTDAEMLAVRRGMQMVFQDPYASLNPRMTVYATLAEPLLVHGVCPPADVPARVTALMKTVGLAPRFLQKYPHEFSGGQRQRVGIARAVATEPELLVLDEPVSALDVSIQAGVVNLLEDLQDRLGLSYMFIAHDLSVVRHISDVVAVMYLGKIVEVGAAEDVYQSAAHPYTQALMSAVPIPDPHHERRRKRIVLEGDVPSPANPPSGCRFRTRCWKAQDICAEVEPLLVDPGVGHPVACHFAEAAQVI